MWRRSWPSATLPSWAIEPRRLIVAKVRPNVALLSILTLALVLRLLWVLRAETVPPPTGDPQWYFAVASNLAAGHGFTVSLTDQGWTPGPGGEPTTLLPPGWPTTLAASFVIFGTGLLTAKLVNVLAGVITVYLVYRIGELSLGRTVALIGALILALYPNHIIWSSTLFSDIYFTMWFSTAICLLLRTSRWRGIQAFVGAGAVGAVTGVAALTRGQGVVLLLVAAVFWLVLCGRRDTLVRTAAASLAAVAVIAPWTVRNLVTFEAPIVISANDGYNLRIGHSPYATGRYILPQDLWDAEPGITMKEREVLFSRLGRERAVDYALSHPREELVLALKKLYYLTIPDSDSIAWANVASSPVAPSWVLESLARLAAAYYWALLLFAAVALTRLRSVTPVRLMGVTLALWAVFHIAFFGEPRYHIPLLPPLALLAATGLRELWRLWYADRRVAPAA